MIYRMNEKRRREQNWENKRTKQKGRKVAFFTQLFLDSLLQGILLHSASACLLLTIGLDITSRCTGNEPALLPLSFRG